MKRTLVFIKPGRINADLREVAAAVFVALGVIDWEERFSANYPPDEHYFNGYCENAEVQIFDSDDGRASEYPVHVKIEDATWRKGRGVIATETSTLVEALVTNGFRVFVPIGPYWLSEWDGGGESFPA